MTFDEWWEIPEDCGDCFRDVAKAAWDAATEEVKKDHFKIGEEVEMNGDSNRRAVIRAVIDVKDGRLLCIDKSLVRRLPAWEPKDGEAVFVRDDNLQVNVARVRDIATNGRCVLVFADGDVCRWEAKELKPFDPDKIGKPWEEV